MKVNLVRQDYHNYTWRNTELLITVGQSVFVVGFLAYFFYRSVYAVIPLSVVGVVYFRKEKRRRTVQSQELLNVQFKECMMSVVTALEAGYAVENAFVESKADMVMLYGKDSSIVQELEGIRRGLVINITLEEQLLDLAKRSASEEIEQFAQVFAIAKRSGGNMTEIIRMSAQLIGDKVDAKQEMKVLLSGRQMEQNIMKLMPFLILAYVGWCYPGYFDSFYGNLWGICVMTACLLVYLAAYWLSERIMCKITSDVGG